MSPEIYFDKSKKRPVVLVRLLPGETSDAFGVKNAEIIVRVRHLLNQRFLDLKTVETLLSEVIGQEQADNFITAFANKEEFSAKF